MKVFTKCKINSGGILPHFYIFQAYAGSETKECFIVNVLDRTALTLLKSIEDNIKLG